MKSRAIIYIVACLIAFSGIISGHVLCFSSDEHMHIEATFNGVDCGHFLPSSLQTNSRHYLTQDTPFPAAACYACIDIPLEFSHYLLQQNSYNTYSHNEKAAIPIAALLFSSFPLIPQGLHPDHGLKLPIKSYCPLNQILSSSLRI